MGQGDGENLFYDPEERAAGTPAVDPVDSSALTGPLDMSSGPLSLKAFIRLVARLNLRITIARKPENQSIRNQIERQAVDDRISVENLFEDFLQGNSRLKNHPGVSNIWTRLAIVRLRLLGVVENEPHDDEQELEEAA